MDGAVDLWPVLLLVATGVHAGFQATVTVLVYPALADVDAQVWQAAHRRHSRRITPLVVVVYGAALVACVGALLFSARGPWVWLAVAATGAAFLVTALGAAPLHARLGPGRDPDLVARLLVVDRVRLGCALLAVVAALLATLP